MDWVRPQIESILAEAVEISSRETRQAFVAKACAGDQILQREVERLIACHFAAGDFLEPRTIDVSAILLSEICEAPGSQIGPYKLLEQIGEGGFGVVFMAEQSSPIRRRVALKILKPGMDTRQIIARFEAERQALALMDHRHIAKVLDAGATESGRPYFVMELVKGMPITRFCDEQSLPVPERLRLFIDVCGAIQHAHQKGIIHRDIKPTNVLVTLQDGKSLVKVIDFGVAKALGQQLTDKTVFTGFAQMVGTPLYMSPEQAALSAVDVDTRSDVYCLGVLLYELLTSTTPFDKQTLLTAGYDELRRMIREDEPPRPSARVSTMDAAALSTISQQRQIDKQKLRQHIRGDLDWIVMKALEKERDRRYESASAFAADIERYLRDEPITARPPSPSYQLRKFARRNRLLLTAAAGIMIALLTGTTVATWQAVRANSERLRAEKAEFGQRQQTEMAMSLLYAAEMRLANQHALVGDDEQTQVLLDHWIPNEGTPDRRGLEWRLLKQRLRVPGEELMRLSGPSTADGSPTSDVSCVRLAPNQLFLVAATDGGLIRRYDLNARHEWPAWETALEDVRRMEFSNDGRHLAAISYSGEIAVVDSTENRVLYRFPKPEQQLGNSDLAFSSDGHYLLSTGEKGQINVWDLDRGTLLRTWKGLHDRILDCAAVPKLPAIALLAAANSGPDGVTLHDVLDGHQIGGFVVDFSVSSLAVSRDGNHIAVGGTQGLIEVWDWRLAKRITTMALTEKINELEFSADGKLLAAAERSGIVHVWRWQRNVTSDAVSENQAGKTSPPNIETLPNDLPLQHAQSAPPDHIHWQAHARPARSIVFAPDQRQVITAGIDGRIVRWMCYRTRGRISVAPSDSVTWVDGRNALALLDVQALWLTDRTTGTTLARFNLPPNVRPLSRLTCASNGRSVVWSTSPGPLLCWDALQDSPPIPLPESDTPVEALKKLEFLPGTQRLVAVLMGSTLQMKTWDTEKCRLLVDRRFETISFATTTLAEAKRKLFALTDRTLHSIDLDSGDLRREWEFDGRDANCLAVAPEGDLLAVGHKNRRIDLVDLATGQVRRTLVGHLGSIDQLQFTPDSKTLLALDGRGILKFWLVTCGSEMLAWPSHQPIHRFNLSSDGNWLAVRNSATELIEMAPFDNLR